MRPELMLDVFPKARRAGMQSRAICYNNPVASPTLKELPSGGYYAGIRVVTPSGEEYCLWSTGQGFVSQDISKAQRISKRSEAKLQASKVFDFCCSLPDQMPDVDACKVE